MARNIELEKKVAEWFKKKVKQIPGAYKAHYGWLNDSADRFGKYVVENTKAGGRVLFDIPGLSREAFGASAGDVIASLMKSKPALTAASYFPATAANPDWFNVAAADTAGEVADMYTNPGTYLLGPYLQKLGNTAAGSRNLLSKGPLGKYKWLYGKGETAVKDAGKLTGMLAGKAYPDGVKVPENYSETLYQDANGNVITKEQYEAGLQADGTKPWQNASTMPAGTPGGAQEGLSASIWDKVRSKASNVDWGAFIRDIGDALGMIKGGEFVENPKAGKQFTYRSPGQAIGRYSGSPVAYTSGTTPWTGV